VREILLIRASPLLTNIALAVQAHSPFVSKTRRVTCRGGAARLQGNATPCYRALSATPVPVRIETQGACAPGATIPE